MRASEPTGPSVSARCVAVGLEPPPYPVTARRRAVSRSAS